MRAMVLTGHGGPEKLQLADLPDPTPKAREVRVRVKACALNHLDLFVREGWPKLKLEMPHVLGSDIAGVVDQAGAEASDLPVGTPVLVNPGLSCGACRECLSGRDGRCRHYSILGEHARGGYAELVCVPRANILPFPRPLSFEQAACIPLVFLTAWEMLVNRAQVAPGETVLVHAAGSGVGSAAIQIAKLCGAKVIATAGSMPKLDKARALGADEVINYEELDFLSEVKRITAKQGVEVVFEHTGAKTFEKSVAALSPGGRLVTCGATTGPEARLDLRVLFWKRISLLGSTMGSKGDLFQIVKLVEEGRLKPVLDQILPLAEAAKAQKLMEERAQFGKIVLVP